MATLLDLSNSTIKGIINTTGFSDSEILLNNSRIDFQHGTQVYDDAFNLNTTGTFCVGDSGIFQVRPTIVRTFTAAHALNIVWYSSDGNSDIIYNNNITSVLDIDSLLGSITTLKLAGTDTLSGTTGFLCIGYIEPSDDIEYPFIDGTTTANVGVRQIYLWTSPIKSDFYRYEYCNAGDNYTILNYYTQPIPYCITYKNNNGARTSTITDGTCSLMICSQWGYTSRERDGYLFYSTLYLDSNATYLIQEQQGVSCFCPKNIGNVYDSVNTTTPATGITFVNHKATYDATISSMIISPAFAGFNFDLQNAYLLSTYSSGTTPSVITYGTLTLCTNSMVGSSKATDNTYNCSTVNIASNNVAYSGTPIINCSTYASGSIDNGLSYPSTPSTTPHIYATTITASLGGVGRIYFTGTDATLTDFTCPQFYCNHTGTVTFNGSITQDILFNRSGSVSSQRYVTFNNADLTTAKITIQAGISNYGLNFSGNLNVRASVIDASTNTTSIIANVYTSAIITNSGTGTISVVGMGDTTICTLTTGDGTGMSVKGIFDTLGFYATTTLRSYTLSGNIIANVVNKINNQNGIVNFVNLNDYHIIIPTRGYTWATATSQTFTDDTDEFIDLKTLWYYTNSGTPDTANMPSYTFLDQKTGGTLTIDIGEVQTILGTNFDNRVQPFTCSGDTSAIDSSLDVLGEGYFDLSGDLTLHYFTKDDDVYLRDNGYTLVYTTIDGTIDTLLYYRTIFVGTDAIDTPRGTRVIYENSFETQSQNTIGFTIPTLH